MKHTKTTSSLPRAGYAAASMAMCLVVSACSSLPKGELALDLGIKDRGVASWYGKEFHGKLAANDAGGSLVCPP